MPDNSGTDGKLISTFLEKLRQPPTKIDKMRKWKFPAELDCESGKFACQRYFRMSDLYLKEHGF